ncbi:MAG: undecaprenyl-diphosphate phosphatase [Clostridia bacterium]|nr:undecaprenyl-diphosphate phosphatase [Clostridia bacterium]MDD3832102.1 undecaprenyl-diphosphate phosphatase [Clostridia bacterium]
MIDILKAILVGIVQGLTEFFPVSSSGHLVLAQEILNTNFGADTVIFELMLHLGTLVSLIIVFFKDILNLFKPPFKKIGLLIIATIPSVIVMALARNQITALFNIQFVTFAFLFTAGVLLLTKIIVSRPHHNELQPLGLKTSIAMGLAQALAVLPGVSRSGCTISAGIISGADRDEVAKFSFFMSAIVIVGSCIVSLFDYQSVNVNFLPIIAGTISAGVTGYFAIKVMMKVIKSDNYMVFVIYLLAVFILSFIFAFIV